MSHGEHDEHPWTILVVDDEPIVHTVTQLVLRNYRFDNRPITLLSAYSAEEAKEILLQRDDIAVALVDVVMETDRAGLDLVRWIRDEIENSIIRIVIRTGQPGVAPEEAVIERYEINDYKQKTELSDTRLVTTVATALRNYRDLTKMDRDYRNLKNLVSVSQPIWTGGDMARLDEMILDRFTGLLDDRTGSAAVVAMTVDGLKVLIGKGRFFDAGLQDADIHILDRLCDGAGPHIDGRTYAARLDERGQTPRFLMMEAGRPFDRNETSVLDAFVTSISLAVTNASLMQTMDRIQRDMLFFLGEVVERRSETTGNHVRRVSHIVRLLASTLGHDEEKAERIGLASSLHDVGKVVVPDEILHKPGKLTPAEFSVIQSHTVVGHDLLDRSDDSFFTLAAEIARSHHERWDGTGYPDNLAGDAIPLCARITAVADVFDALSHTRSYKAAWPVDETVAYIQRGANTQFDATVVAAFIDVLNEIEAILVDFPD